MINREVSGLQGRLQTFPNVKWNENIKVLFIEKIKCAARLGVRSITWSTLDRNLICTRSSNMRSVVASCTFDRGRCVWPYCIRSQKMRSIADNYLRIPMAQVLKRWRLGPARATRGLRLTWPVLDLMRCDWPQCTRSHQVQSITGVQIYLYSPIARVDCNKVDVQVRVSNPQKIGFANNQF